MIYLLIGYLFLYIHRPFEVWPALGDLRVELVYTLVMGVAWLCSGRKRWVPNPMHAAVLAFAVAVGVCWAVSPWASESSDAVEKYFKMLVGYVLLVSVVRDEEDLRLVVRALVVVMALYMLHSLREFRNGRHEYRMGIVRMVGVDVTFSNPNAFAASIVYLLPFVPAAWASSPSRWWRRFLVGYVALSAGCVALTGSRGGFVGLLLCVALHGRLVGRRWWAYAAGLVLAAPVLWMLLPDYLQNRFETIIKPEVGPENAQISAEGRIQGLLTGLRLWGQYPVTGCGPGLWKVASGTEFESHNLYGQLLGEMGTLGALAFGAMLLCCWLNVRRVRAEYRRHPEWGQDFLYVLTGSCSRALLLMLFAGNFGHNLFRANWLWCGAFLVVAADLVAQRAADWTAPYEAGEDAAALPGSGDEEVYVPAGTR
jgi:hypothetical protein